MAGKSIKYSVEYYDSNKIMVCKNPILRRQDFEADVNNMKTQLALPFTAILVRETREESQKVDIVFL